MTSDSGNTATLPAGQIVNQLDDTAGPLVRVELPGSDGVIQPTHDIAPMTNHLQTIAGPDPVTVQIARAGPFPLAPTWSRAEHHDR